MFKQILVCCMVMGLATSIQAQTKGYGLVLGANFYDNESNYHLNGTQVNQTAPWFGRAFEEETSEYSALHIGVFYEYAFTNNIGLVTELAFNTKQRNESLSDQLYKFGFIELSPSLKYDFGQEYNKGFYLLLGPRVSFLTNVNPSGTYVEDNFETLSMGAQFGLGHRILKIIDLQAKLDYGLTPFFKLNDNNYSTFRGVYLSLNVDMQNLF